MARLGPVGKGRSCECGYRPDPTASCNNRIHALNEHLAETGHNEKR